MSDVRDLLTEATLQLGERIDAEALLLHALGKPRSWLIAHAADTLPTEVQSTYAALVHRRAAGEPVAYITGRRGFWSLDLR